MENVMFGFLLWFVVFTFLCWLVTPSVLSVPEAVMEKAENREKEGVLVLGNTVAYGVAQGIKNALHHPDFKNLVYAELFSDAKQKPNPSLDVESLSLRELRQVIRVLNEGLPKNDPRRIKQKVNKKDVPLDWLRAQVKTRLQEEPHQLEKVLAALAA